MPTNTHTYPAWTCLPLHIQRTPQVALWAAPLQQAATHGGPCKQAAIARRQQGQLGRNFGLQRRQACHKRHWRLQLACQVRGVWRAAVGGGSAAAGWDTSAANISLLLLLQVQSSTLALLLLRIHQQHSQLCPPNSPLTRVHPHQAAPAGFPLRHSEAAGEPPLQPAVAVPGPPPPCRIHRAFCFRRGGVAGAGCAVRGCPLLQGPQAKQVIIPFKRGGGGLWHRPQQQV